MKLTKTELEQLVGRKLNFNIKDDNLVLATTYKNTNLLEENEDKSKKPYEHFQIFDHNDQPIKIDDNDLIFYRKECHGQDRIKEVYHRGANAFIINENEELLVPIRSPDKDLFPSMSDVSVSEHVNVRENYFDSVLRGFEEEQGVSVDPKRLSLVTKTPVIDSEQSEMCEYYVFLHKNEQYNISEETSSQRWVPITDLANGDIGIKLNFRPDHLPALEKFISERTTIR
jgi:isopentenyldiphosphate isomerase